MNIAAKVQRDKAQHPEDFCEVKGCLWRIYTARGVSPCRNHSVGDSWNNGRTPDVDLTDRQRQEPLGSSLIELRHLEAVHVVSDEVLREQAALLIASLPTVERSESEDAASCGGNRREAVGGLDDPSARPAARSLYYPHKREFPF